MSNKPLRQIKTCHTQLLGHRGARGEVFENTRQAFEYLVALAQQSNGKLIGIEFDVQLTHDNQLVIFHDDSLLRLFHQQSRLDQLTYTELSRRSGLYDELMLLNETPELLENFKRIELEIKTHSRTNYRNLLSALSLILTSEKFLSLPITLTSFDTYLLNLIKSYPVLSKYRKGLLVEPNLIEPSLGSINPFIKYIKPKIKDSESKYLHKSEAYNSENNRDSIRDTALLKEYSKRLPSFARFLDCDHLGLHFNLYNHDIIDQCRLLNLSTSAWTVNNFEDAFKIISLGVDNLITDYPSTMLTLFK